DNGTENGARGGFPYRCQTPVSPVYGSTRSPSGHAKQRCVRTVRRAEPDKVVSPCTYTFHPFAVFRVACRMASGVMSGIFVLSDPQKYPIGPCIGAGTVLS